MNEKAVQDILPLEKEKWGKRSVLSDQDRVFMQKLRGQKIIWYPIDPPEPGRGCSDPRI